LFVVIEYCADVEVRPVEVDEFQHGADEYLLRIAPARLETDQTLSAYVRLVARFVYRPAPFLPRAGQLLPKVIFCHRAILANALTFRYSGFRAAGRPVSRLPDEFTILSGAPPRTMEI
jgi:hypothetical protein